MDFTAFTSAPGLPPASIYLFGGPEGFLREKGLKTLRDRNPDWADQTIRFFSSDVTWAQLEAELYTPNLLGGQKLVILIDEGNFAHNHKKQIEEYLTKPSPVGTLALSLGGRLPAIKSKGILIIQCKTLRSLDLIRWVTADFQRKQKTVNRAAVQLLVERGGGDLASLEGHVENIVQYVGSRRNVTPEDVTALVKDQGTNATYELSLAAASKKQSKALEILHRLLAHGEPFPVLLWKLAWQYRKLVEAKKLLKAGVRKYEVPSRVQITYYPDEFLGLVDNHSLEELLEKHQRILDTDLSLKTGGGMERLLLDKLVCELSSATPDSKAIPYEK
jgi:DNA polymerase III delta subunit